MKIDITGASNFVNRMYEACGPYQWAREFLKNSLEANATKVEFGIEWQAVEKFGHYRRTIADNGSGMSSEELREFFKTLGTGAKKIGGVHDNFGVGAKIASLPWNPEGVVVVSYKDGIGSMIWIQLDESSGDYELVDFSTDAGTSCVIGNVADVAPIEGINWGQLRPEWLKDHGTIIVLLGSSDSPHTILGNPSAGENSIKGLSVYLNSRFWDLTKVDVKVIELRSERPMQWPTSPSERDDRKRPNNRTINGARYYLDEVEAPDGVRPQTGTLLLDEGRVRAQWYLWEGKRPSVHTYARENGYVAVRYKDELFEHSFSKPTFRWFGIVESKVQQNVTIVLEPDLYSSEKGRWGVYSDQSRNRLIFTGDGDKGASLPIADWGQEFGGQLPDAIMEAIRLARGENTGSIDDEEYRKRLQDKFGARWAVKVLTKSKPTTKRGEDATRTDETAEVFDEPDDSETHDRDSVVPSTRRKRKSVKVVRSKMAPTGSDSGVARESPVDVPKWREAHKEDFEKEWHLAMWNPNDRDGPTVLLNVDSPILQDIVEYHQSQYHDVHAEDVARVVRSVFGEIAACKIAHSQRLRRLVNIEDLDGKYRSEEGLTLALMGLMAEEAVLSPRLGKFGKKKASS